MDRATTFADRHLALLVTGVTTMAFVGKILYATAFDVTTGLAVVSATPNGTLLLGLAVALTPSVTYLLLGWSVATLARRAALRQPVFPMVVTVTSLAAFIALSWSVGVVLVSAIGMAVIVIPQFFAIRSTAEHGTTAATEKVTLWGSRAILLLVPLVLLAILLGPDPWPTERLVLDSGKPTVGFVLDSGSRWWPVLNDQTRRITYILGESVQERVICRRLTAGKDWWNRSIGDLTYPRPPLPHC